MNDNSDSVFFSLTKEKEPSSFFSWLFFFSLRLCFLSCCFFCCIFIMLLHFLFPLFLFVFFFFGLINWSWFDSFYIFFFKWEDFEIPTKTNYGQLFFWKLKVWERERKTENELIALYLSRLMAFSLKTATKTSHTQKREKAGLDERCHNQW